MYLIVYTTACSVAALFPLVLVAVVMVITYVLVEGSGVPVNTHCLFVAVGS